METPQDMTDENDSTETTQQSLNALGGEVEETLPPDTGEEPEPSDDPDTGEEPEPSDDPDDLVELRTKRRSRDDKKDIFRYWIRLPDSLAGDSEYLESEEEYVQVTFTNGEGGGIGAAETGKTLARDTIEGVAGIYLRKAPHETDGSEVASSRKVRDDPLGKPVTLPPKVVTDQAGLGIDGDSYNSKDITLLFEPILREDGVLLTPVGYDDGSTYELPETPEDAESITEYQMPDQDPAEKVLEGEYAGLDVESLPKNVVPLAQRKKESSYGYSVHLRKALSGMGTNFEGNEKVTVTFEESHEDADPNGRYDEGFEPAIVLGKIKEGDDVSLAPDARTLQTPGFEVVIPPKFVTEERDLKSLGIKESRYNSTDNPLLFEVLIGPNVVGLEPIGYQDGTEYPIPKATLSRPGQQPKIQGSEYEDYKYINKKGEWDFGEDEYVDGTAISTDTIRDIASEVNISKREKLIESLVATEECINREELKEEGIFDTDYPPLFPEPNEEGKHELGDAAPVVDIIEPEVWAETIIPEIVEVLDDKTVKSLEEILRRIHGQEAMELVWEDGSDNHRGFYRDKTGIVTLSQ